MTMTPQAIYDIRDKLHWSLQQVADYTGYKKYQVQRMENGVLAISPEFNKRLINAIKVHITDAEKIISFFSK